MHRIVCSGFSHQKSNYIFYKTEIKNIVENKMDIAVHLNSQLTWIVTYLYRFSTGSGSVREEKVIIHKSINVSRK